MSEMSAERQAGVILTADVTDYRSNIQQASDDTKSLGDQVDALGKQLSKIAKIAGGTLVGIAAADPAVIGKATHSYAQYEEQLSSLQATAAQTGRSFETMSGSVDKLRRDFPTTTREAAALIQTLEKMKQPEGNVRSMADTFMKLGGATGESVQGLTTSLLDLQKQMGTPQTETRRMANVLSELADDSQASATGIAQFASQLAPIARTAGMSQTELMGVSKAFQDAGQDGFRAANLFNTMLGDITTAVATGSPEISKYANLIGTTNEQFKEMGSAEQITKIFEEVNRLGPSAIDTLNRMGIDGTRAISAFQGVAAQGGIRSALQEAGIASADPNASNLERGAAGAFGGIIDQTKKFRTEMEQTWEAIGETFAPVAESFMKAATAMVRAIRMLADSPIGKVAAELAGLMAAPVAAAGGLLAAAPQLLTAAGAFGLLRSSFSQGIKDSRSGFRMGQDIDTRAPMVLGGTDTTREMTKTGRHYANLNPLQRMQYAAAHAIGPRLPAFDPNATGTSIASRAAAMPFRAATGGLGLASGFLSPLAYGAVDDMSRRDTILPKGGWRESMGQAGRNIGGWFGGGGGAAPGEPVEEQRKLTKEFREANERAKSATGFRKLPAFFGFGGRAATEMAGEAVPPGAGTTKPPTGVTPPVGAGDTASVKAAETTRRAMTGVGAAAAGTARAFGAFEIRLASATAGLGKLAAGAASSAVGGLAGLGRGAMGLAGAMGPLGWTMIGGTAAYMGYQKAQEGTKEKYADIQGDEMSLVEGWTGEIQLATRNTASFAQALQDAENSLPTPDTAKQALKLSQEELTIAQHSERKLSNPALAEASIAGAKAMIAPQWEALQGDPQALQAAQMDLIQQFDVKGMQEVFQYARRNAGDMDTGMVLRDIYSKDVDDRKDLMEGLSGLISDNRDLVMVNKGEAEAVKESRDMMGDYLTTMTRQLFPNESAAPGMSDPGAWISGEEAQGIEAFKDTFFSGLKSAGYFKSDPFKDVEFEEAVELANQGKIEDAINNIINQIEAAGQYELVEDYETPQQRRRRRRQARRDPRTGEEEPEVTPTGPMPASAFDFGPDIEPTAAGGRPDRRLPRQRAPEITGANLTPEQLREYRMRYGGIPGEGWSTRRTSDDVGTQSLGIADLMYTDPTIQKALTPATATTNMQFQARERMETYLGARPVGDATRQVFEGLGRAGDPNSREYQLLEFGYQGMQRQQQFEAPYQTRLGQAQVAAQQWQQVETPTADMLEDPNIMARRDELENQFEQSKAGMYNFYKGIVQAFRQFDIMRERAIEDRATQEERAYYDFNLSRERQEHDFQLSRTRATEDFQTSRERAEYDFHLQRQHAQHDFHLSRNRAEEDFNLSRRRAQTDYNIQVRQSTADFNMSRRRQEQDYQLQTRRMIEDTAKAAQNIYERIQVKPTWSAENLLGNAEEQLVQFEQQSKNLDRLRGMGVSSNVIQQLDLANPEQAQQLEAFVNDIADNPRLVKKYNQMMRRRVSAVSDLVRDEDNTSFRRMEEDYEKSVRRGSRDFQRAMRRGHEAFQRAMNRQGADFERSMDRQVEDFSTAMERSSDAFELSMDRNQEDFGKTMRRNAKDFDTATDRATIDFEESITRMRKDFGKQMRRAQEDINEMAHEITGSFNSMMDRAINRLTGGARQMAREVKATFRDVRGETNRIGVAHMKELYDIYGLNWEKKGKTLQDVSVSGGKLLEGGSQSGSGQSPGKGMAAGGVLPGWTPGQDVHEYRSRTAPPLRLSGGEAFMVPQFTQAVGGEPGVKRLNQLAREGKLEQKFARGGVFQNPDRAVSWDGHRISAIAAAQLRLAEKLTNNQISMMQGGYGGTGYSASGTSHNYPGVADIAPATIAMERVLRRVGFAAWARNIPGRYSVGSGDHIHAVSLLDPGNRGHGQISSWRSNTTGLPGHDPDQAPHYPWLPNLREQLGAMNLSALAGAGGGGGMGAALTLSNLPGMRSRYGRVEDRIAGTPILGGLPKNAMSQVLNRLYRARARQMVQRRGIPGGALGYGLPGGGGLGDYDLVAGDYGGNARGVWNALLAAGFSKAHAAGIMGNMESESGFDPYIVQGGGHSMNPAAAGSGGYGLVQWTPGSKLSDYLKGDKPTVANQINVLAAQLAGKGPHPEGAAGAALRSTRTVAQAARSFEVDYERHAGPPQPNRITQAQAIHRKFAAGGGVFQNGAQDVVIGERGPEAVLPLNHRGVDFLAELMQRMSPGMESKRGAVRGSVPAVHNNTYNYKVDSSTNFTGAITVQSQDPNEMARKLEAKKRMAALTQPVLTRR